MNILLVFDTDFSIDQSKLLKLLDKRLSHIKFEIFSKDFKIEDSIISKPQTFNKVSKTIGGAKADYNRIFCFTGKQFIDNYFIHEHNDLAIFSVYGWSFLTDLPISNGVIYFIIDYFALEIDSSGFRHQDITGCVYDFLVDKRGVDHGMRQARFCSNCLKRISESITTQDDLNIFEDLKSLMNHLSECSRWNRNVLEGINISDGTIAKRFTKNKQGIQVVIASPGDTEAERRILIDSLERRFRIGNHENHCGFRLMVTGWEDLASQPGYPQDVINRKIIQESDFVIAIFKHRLGTPTKDESGNIRAESGSVEELLQTLDKSKEDHPIGMAYFHSKAPVISLDLPEKDKIEKEWDRLTKFKKAIQDQMIYKPYTDSSELLTIVLGDLEKNIIDFIKRRN